MMRSKMLVNSSFDKRAGVLRPGMGEDLFPAAGIVDLFVEDSFGGGDILDHAGAAIQQVDQCDVDVIDLFPAVLQKLLRFLGRHFFILSASDRARASRPPGSFSICRTIALPTTTPSAIFATAPACSGVEIPNPAASGSLVALRIFSINGASESGQAPLVRR